MRNLLTVTSLVWEMKSIDMIKPTYKHHGYTKFQCQYFSSLL